MLKPRDLPMRVPDKKRAARGDGARPQRQLLLCCNNNVNAEDGGCFWAECLQREWEEVVSDFPRPECERFRRHRDGECLLIDAYRTQAPGASPGIDEVTAMEAACGTIRLHVHARMGDRACSVVVIVLGTVMCGCRSSKRRNEHADGGEGNDAVKHEGDPKCLQCRYVIF